jgi:hypothetical protein
VKGVRRFFCLVVVTVSVNLLVGVAHAQSQRNPWEKFSIAVGGFLTETDTSIEIESRSLGVGAAIDIENVLGVERSFSTYRIDARYRFGQSRRHEVEFHYFSSGRNGVKVLEDDLQIGDVFFPAGTGVASIASAKGINRNCICASLSFLVTCATARRAVRFRRARRTHG